MLSPISAQASHIEYTINTLALTDSNHTGPLGERVSAVDAPDGMNENGQVIGVQTFYNTTAVNDDEEQSPRYGQSAWFFSGGIITRIGLTDNAAHVDGDTNYQFSEVVDINEGGYVVGHSQRFSPGTSVGEAGVTPLGQSAWVHFGGTTTRIGIPTDGYTYEHQNAAESIVRKLNEAEQGEVPQIVGTTHLFRGGGGPNAGNDAGTAVWRYADTGVGGATTRIGLFGAEHTSTIGTDAGYAFQSGSVTFLNDHGIAAGEALRYHATQAPAAGSPTFQTGKSAWLQTLTDPAQKLGFTDTDHTQNATDAGAPAANKRGTQSSTLVALNNPEVESNTVAVGHSTRYDAASGDLRGQSAWFQTVGAGPTAIGFVTGAHVSNNGTRSSTPIALNDEGIVIGTSKRYVTGTNTENGQSAWVYNEAQGMQQVGLTDVLHTGTNSIQSSTPMLFNSLRHVAGTSLRYNGAATTSSKSAWVFDPNSLQSNRVGFFADGNHTRDDGFEDSSVTAMNELGFVAGQSTRYTTGQAGNWGSTAWIYNGTNTVDISLDNFNHESSNGFRSSSVQFLNDAGQAAGFALRMNGGSYNPLSPPDLGQSGWFWDSSLTDPIELAFSLRSADNASNTNIFGLSEDGVVFGAYTLYSGASESQHAFLWDFNEAPADRFHDLGLFVENGLPANGWNALNQALEMSGLGHIRGIGTTSGGLSLPYLLTPVPEPAGLALAAMAGLAMLPRRRRKQA